MTLTAGLGFKARHLDEALTSNAPGLWFEVHADNYMVDGGPRLAALDALRERHPISLHAVGLSLASVDPPDPEYLRRLAGLTRRIEPVAVSDHLAWQAVDGARHADFLPFPRNPAALTHVCANVARVQEALGRELLVENPSLYVDLPGHEMSEAEFLGELVRRTGCGLLLDINNLYVSAGNLGFEAEAALAALPTHAVAEIHLAGHGRDADTLSPLLIDTHAAPVAAAVWALYASFIAEAGPRPTLIERDDAVPAFPVLMDERRLAHDRLVEASMVHV